jgi:hypothetical protein
MREGEKHLIKLNKFCSLSQPIIGSVLKAFPVKLCKLFYYLHEVERAAHILTPKPSAPTLLGEAKTKPPEKQKSLHHQFFILILEEASMLLVFVSLPPLWFIYSESGVLIKTMPKLFFLPASRLFCRSKTSWWIRKSSSFSFLFASLAFVLLFGVAFSALLLLLLSAMSEQEKLKQKIKIGDDYF